MIQVIGLEKSYGKQHLFADATFTIAPGERIGLIGRNGHGKTTLFRLLLGEEERDGGEIVIPKGYRIGHLSQHLKFAKPTVLEEATEALIHPEEGWGETHRAEEILAGLGFEEEQLHLSPSLLPGGFQIRLNLAKVLLGDPNLLLLDEPTNYLDVVSMRWLQRFLRAWRRELIIITHDRAFMDSVTTHTVMIHRTRIRKCPGDTAKLVAQILLEEEIHEKTRANEEKKREAVERFIDRFRAQATRARAVQSRVKLLEKREKLEKLDAIENLEFSFREAPFPGKWLLRVEDLRFGFDKERPLMRDLSVSIGKGDRIAVIGKNGKGKSTLLNLLAGELKADGGVIAPSPNLQLGYFGQTNVQRLTPSKTVEQEIGSVQPEHSRSVVRNICGAMMFEGDNALKPIQVLSGGEKSRVLLGKILAAPANLLLLDEPTNHLDMESVDSLVEAVGQFEGAVVIVTHSEMILRALATRLIVFDRGAATLFEGTYDDFLARGGWGDEGAAGGGQGGGTEGLSKRELRRQRAQQKELIRPIEREMKKIEEEISRHEQVSAECTRLLIEIDPAADPSRFSQLAKDRHNAVQEIERLFKRLEGLYEKLKEAEKGSEG